MTPVICIKHIPYSIPFQNGMKGNREGFIAYLQVEGKTPVAIDIAPLPGWSRESLNQVDQELRSMHKKGITSSSIPSVEWGIYVARNLFPFTPKPHPTAALLMGSHHEILKQAKEAQSKGITTAKVKIKNLQDPLPTLLELIPFFKLRIDCNRTLSIDEALSIAESLPIHKIDYFEEPLEDPQQLVEFPYPYALDESARQFPHLKSNIHILKPMLGSFTPKNRTILSSSFETDLGLLALCALADSFGLHEPMGFGTLPFLSTGLLQNETSIQNGHLLFPSDLKLKKEYQ